MNRLSEAARELAAATMALVAELAKTQRLDWADANEARVFTALDRVLGLLAAERAAEPTAAAAAESFGAFLGRQIGRAAIEAAEQAERAAAAARPAPPPFPGPSRRLALDKPAANWFSKCCDCGTFAPQIDRRCWGCAERERLRSGRIFPVKMGWGGDGVCSLCQWTCWSEPGVALRPAAGEPAVSLCYVCVWFLARLGVWGGRAGADAAAAPAENPPSKPAPQVPGNTGGASAQTEVPKNDRFTAPDPPCPYGGEAVSSCRLSAGHPGPGHERRRCQRCGAQQIQGYWPHRPGSNHPATCRHCGTLYEGEPEVSS